MRIKNKIIKTLTTRLFVAFVLLGAVGWIILFGKNLPSSFTPVVYAILVIFIIASIYVYWKKPDLLHKRKVIIGLLVFIIIGVIGWITSISEITDCRPYKCGENFICAKPTDLGLKITTGECSSEFSGDVDFYCVKENDVCVKKLNNILTITLSDEEFKNIEENYIIYCRCKSREVELELNKEGLKYGEDWEGARHLALYVKTKYSESQAKEFPRAIISGWNCVANEIHDHCYWAQGKGFGKIPIVKDLANPIDINVVGFPPLWVP